MPDNNIREVRVYDQEYFSGAQVNVYIGDVLIDEVVSIQMRVEETKKPVFGYASERFDAVMKGQVFVQGSMQINFKESGYLYAVLQRYKHLNKLNQQPGPLSPFISTKNVGIPRGGARRNGERGGLSRLNADQMQDVRALIRGEKDGRRLTTEQKLEYYNSLSGFNNRQGALPGAEDFYEAFEDEVWGVRDFEARGFGARNARRTTDYDLDDFNIYVVFGDYNRNNRLNHTVKRIDNVSLTGQSQIINIDGVPVYEQYNFFARDFV